jgi:hypothetical protein
MVTETFLLEKGVSRYPKILAWRTLKLDRLKTLCKLNDI